MVNRDDTKKKVKVIFTDLDNTILFSNKQDRVDGDKCVEYRLAKEQGYMLEKLESVIEEIEGKRKDIFIVPITTRSVEQYFRTSLSDMCRYAITTCGGNLFSNRKPVVNWIYNQQSKMEYIANYIYDTFTYLNKFCGDSASFCRIVDNFYVFLRSEDKDKIKELEGVLRSSNEREEIETEISIYNTGTKLTVLPSFLNKGYAVFKFLKEIKKFEGYGDNVKIETYGFGDSEFDIPMLNKVDHVMCSPDLVKYISKKENILGSTEKRFDKEILSLLESL